MQTLTLTADTTQTGGLKNPNLKLEEKPVPVPGPGECLIEVAYCGICGSDFSMASAGAQGAMEYSGLCSPPVTLGHEFSGRVKYSEIFASGSAVVAEETFGCLLCKNCLTKGEHSCDSPQKIGFTKDGAFAASVVVPERKCWSIEPILQRYGRDAGMQLAALVQPYSIAYSCFRALDFPGLQAKESLLLLGAGPIGLCAIDLARALGAGEVHVIEPWLERRSIALKLGANRVYSHESNVPNTFCTDWLVDSSGIVELPEIAKRHLSQNGKLVLLSKAISTSHLRLVSESRTRVLVPDGHACPDSYPRIISLLASGELKGDPMISGIVNLEGALQRLKAQRKSPGKLLVKP